MKPKSQKKEEVAKLKEKFPKSKITVFSSFARAHSADSASSLRAGSGQAGEKGLSVAQMSELKKLLRQVDAEYFVSKKTLIDVALKNLKYGGADVYSMDGSIGLVLGTGDPYAIAKKLYEFAKKNTALQFFGALLGNSFIDKEQFMEMAKMPSRETLLAGLFGMMKYPISSLAIVLNQIKEKQANKLAS